MACRYIPTLEPARLLIRRGRFEDLIDHYALDGHLTRLQFEAEFIDGLWR